MSNLTKQLKGFEKRVRLVRSWRGLAMGACFGAGCSAIWALLDLRSVLYTEWSWMAALTGGSAVVGALVGLFMRVPLNQLAESIDRRAGLADRLTTANERTGSESAFDNALSSDAEGHLATVKPKRVYPIRFGRWQTGALALGLVAAVIFALGNTPIALSDQAKKDRVDLKKQGEMVQRVAKENFETPEAKQEMTDGEKRLADEMRKLDRDLEKGRMSKEEALQKSNELAQKADELMKSAAKESEASLSQAQTAREALEKDAMKQAGIDNMSPQMSQMSDSDRQKQMDQAKQDGKKIQAQLDALRRKLEEIKRKLENKNLSAAERKALEEVKKALENQISKLESEKRENQDLQKALQLSKEAQEVFAKMQQDPLYKELMEIEKKLAANSKSQSSAGRPKLTDEQRAEIKKQLEELAKKLKDAKAMKAYLEALIEAMKKANQLGRCNGANIGLGNLPLGGNSMMQAPAGPGQPTEDIWMGDTGHIHKLDKAEKSRGTTTTDVISGDPRPSDGSTPYVEIRAPSMVGNRTSVPYRDVLPSYEKKAESALSRQQIPKEHQQRVKAYFDSLTGAKKN